MSTNTNVQLIPGDLVLSGDIKTDEVTPTFSVDRQNSRVGIGIDASSISNPYAMYVAGEMYATRLHGDGSQLSGLTDSAWGQAGGDISYVDGDVSIGIADANGKRLRVHESGNDVLVADGANLRVGVATGTPQANLHVEGNVYVSSNLEVSNVNFTGNLYQNGTLFEGGGGGGGVWTETGNDIYYTTGNVGVGTTNPGASLHVEGNAYVSGDLEIAGNLGSSLVNLIYPIGAIYISVNSTDPGTIWSGTTWVAFGAGKTLVGLDSGDTDFDQVEETGGAKTHTLTVNEMPAHNHTFSDNVRSLSTQAGYPNPTSQYNPNLATNVISNVTDNSGGGESHNNLQPYIVTYMWKRTA
jgi:hypothetical protein